MKLCKKGLHDLDNPVAVKFNSRGERQCGPCQLVAGLAWQRANPKRVSQATRKWRLTNPDKVRAIGRAYRASQPGRRHERDLAWRAAHPELHQQRVREYNGARRARIAQVLSTLTAEEWEAILVAAGYACIYCGSHAQLTQDHLTPLSRGGDDSSENVAPACLPCNQSKHTQTVEEFLSEEAG